MRLWLRLLCMILRTFCTHASNTPDSVLGVVRGDTAKCWMGERRGALTHGSAACRSAGMRWSVWVMRQECRSLGMRGWYWRARLSGSAAEQLILGGFCHCCFCTHCYYTLLFCSVSYFCCSTSVIFTGLFWFRKVITLSWFLHALAQPVRHHKRWLLSTKKKQKKNVPVTGIMAAFA